MAGPYKFLLDQLEVYRLVDFLQLVHIVYVGSMATPPLAPP